MSEEKIIKKVTSTPAGLAAMEKLYRKHPESEIIPFARNTSFTEIAETAMPDKDGPWKNPVALFQTLHKSQIGALSLCRKAREYLEQCATQTPLDILSITAGMEGDFLQLTLLIRFYDVPPKIENLYSYLQEVDRRKPEETNESVTVRQEQQALTEEEKQKRNADLQKQEAALQNSSEEHPFLNQLDSYTMLDSSYKEEMRPEEYDLKTRDMQISTMLPYDRFIQIFQSCMRYITTVERDCYYNALLDKIPMSNFTDVLEAYINRTFISSGKMTPEDLPALLKKLHRALFELYIVQDLIDDPKITDIKITAPDAVRVRVNGRAYLSNVTFIDREDYLRFVKSVAVKNGIDLRIPTQSFTDDHDKDYILRFSFTAPYITGSGLPIVHIRKVPRHKLTSDDLLAKGMFDEKIRDYLLDAGKNSRGVVFAGPPGSGKTIMLNWFLEEAYESSAEILVIQENDELFSDRKGIMFEHVVSNPREGERACSMEDLGRMALVSGANVFVIGEAKGAEICSAITLSNSGCRTAITIHSPSAEETVDKMADLAMRGYATSFEQAKRMIKSFQTIVYLKDFKVQEITEIIGYDDEKKDMIYRPIYKRETDE